MLSAPHPQWFFSPLLACNIYFSSIHSTLKLVKKAHTAVFPGQTRTPLFDSLQGLNKDWNSDNLVSLSYVQAFITITVYACVLMCT